MLKRVDTVQYRIEIDVSQVMASYPHARLGSSCHLARHHTKHGRLLCRTIHFGRDRKRTLPGGGFLSVDVVQARGAALQNISIL